METVVVVEGRGEWLVMWNGLDDGGTILARADTPEEAERQATLIRVP